MSTSTTNRIAGTFARCKAENRTALMPFVTAGYPTMEITEKIIHAIVDAGADLIEIGTPFSDPLADGTTVQRTSQVSLDNGTKLKDCIALAKRVRDAGIEVPLMLMGYFNPIVKYGVERYVTDCAEAGIDGFIVPDLPIEESERIRDAARQHGCDLIFMTAPTSTDERLRKVGELGGGFVYCVSVTGVTGARESLSGHLGDYLARVRSFTDLPLAVGFGISTPEHVGEVGTVADGAIVASAMINYTDTFPLEEQPEAAARFVCYLKGEGEL
ncbi:MAG TPA: tryptophan synthase subunit alpha [Thermomicrobiales bacterium]|nr:tryptophan synthase subunit alpha [Thermomicrobiales bacterium]